MKKQNILLIAKILENESDFQNPMTQTKIANIISEVYPCDRKTVGRNIRFLINMGYPIVKTHRGFYMDKRIFTLEERELILISIQQNAAIEEERKAEITKRLIDVLNKLQR